MGNSDDRLNDALRELSEARASILARNRLTNDLIAVLAHDIKGPLTSIIGFAELLEEGFLEGKGATDAARTIRSNAERLATLANDILALSRVERGELDLADETVDVGDIVERAIETSGSGRPFARAFPSHPIVIRGDGERLRGVFENLIRNAVKYSPDESPIDVTIASLDGEVEVVVRDRGMGIPPEDFPKLFERFSRASNAKRAKIAGTGIGLYVARAIVEGHGGTIEAHSTLEEGSTFTVRLPLAPTTKRVKILSSNDAFRNFVAFALRSNGYRVREAATLSDLSSGDIRSGDVIIVEGDGVEAAAVQAAGAPNHVLTLGVGSRDGTWDAKIPAAFLMSDIFEATSLDSRLGGDNKRPN